MSVRLQTVICIFEVEEIFLNSVYIFKQVIIILTLKSKTGKVEAITMCGMIDMYYLI